MDRRDFLKSTGALIVGTSLPATNAALASGDSGIVLQGREVFPINRGWRYSRTSTPESHVKSFDDGQFERVVVPHTTVRLPWHFFDEKSYAGVSLYRRPLKLPKDLNGRRVFVDFEGVMTASTVWLNGTRLGEYTGGYTPFSFELTQHLDPSGDNLLAVDVDSSERSDIPPFGYEVDYLTFGGIYREVALRIVPRTYIENFKAIPKDVLSKPRVEVTCYLDHDASTSPKALSVQVELRDGDNVLSKAIQKIDKAVLQQKEQSVTLSLTNLSNITLWDLQNPKLYEVHVTLLEEGQPIDQETRRIGFREAVFTDHGFSLNGKILKLRGLDRHQTFPYMGQAMPGRVQRRDADILRKQFKCNIVRTSHYPQSRHFLDRCDEIGLLVLEEIPGWQHIGDQSWQDISVDNVSRMIRRDWNHPSIILWGVRINESRDNHDFYVRTNAMAHQLDPSRQTGGIRYFQESEFLEDVFTMNDFGFPLKEPNHPRYLNTEFVGHTFPCKTIDTSDHVREHTLRHARIHDQLASNPQYAGGIGWCAFDYNTHSNFGSGDRICYHGVADIFREPKPAAGFYKSQCDPEEEVVLEPAFHWAHNDEPVGFTTAMICSNCDHLKFYLDFGKGFQLAAESDPDRKQFPHLRYAPFMPDFKETLQSLAWGDLRIEGYIEGELAITKTYSGRGTYGKFVLLPDDKELFGDGADTTRVVMKVLDPYGDAVQVFASEAITLELDGPAELIGENPSALVGGTMAVWIRAKEESGTVRLRAKHPYLGTQEVQIQIKEAPVENL
jgi:beta-galactosidase